MLTAASLLLLLGCQPQQRQNTTADPGVPTAIIPDHPVWVNASCPTRTIRLLTANVPPEDISIRLNNTTVEGTQTPVSEATAANQIYWTVEIPIEEGYQQLSVVQQKEGGEEQLASASILYMQPGEDVRLFSQHTELQPRAYIDAPICWPDYKGAALPGGTSFTLSYDRKQVDRIFASDMRRTIELSDVTLKEDGSGTVYRVEPPLNYTVTIPDAIALLNRVDGLGGIDLGDKGRMASLSQVVDVEVESTSDATPSYRVVKYKYGSEIVLRIKDCTTVDTLSRTPFIVPDHIRIELGCEPN